MARMGKGCLFCPRACEEGWYEGRMERGGVREWMSG